ncbi:cell wall integrity and stress response component 2-like isoform X1 [Gigantopelta aegis]|uniref:cell wall integrity and stress response component 2-like isoform X1 n=1 Tax=Gigantopelta aegis TaxID=1735272 RepID=UPI001B88AF57|nr:cell wall integrity and stress response component 2-like isoform X1 [Gigantopelta aegis]
METVKVPGILPLLMIATFCIIADQASGKRACQQLPGSASSQVINMCEDNAASSSDRFYLDVFSNSSTSLSCVCFLQVRGLVEIDFKQNIISGDSCLTTITIYSQNTSQHVFSCRNDSLATTATLATGSSALELKTSTTSQESASCLQLYRKGGTGSLRVECISPAANTTTSRPTTSAASSSTSSSTSDSTSSTSDSTSSTSGSTSRATSDSITSNSYSTNSSSQSTSSISDFTSSTSGSTSTSTRDSTQSDDFPVAAIAGAAAAIVLILLLVVVVAVIIIRKRKRPTEDVNAKPRPEDNDGVVNNYNTTTDESPYNSTISDDPYNVGTSANPYNRVIVLPNTDGSGEKGCDRLRLTHKGHPGAGEFNTPLIQ